MKSIYMLLDARAAFTGDGSVMLSGTADECCEAANSNEYGEGCVVANNEGIIWEWFASGKWIPETNESKNIVQQPQAKICPECDGTGTVHKEKITYTCDMCYGTGKRVL